jgi:gp16 family phage-associated protein
MSHQCSTLKSLPEVRQRFLDDGVSVAGWARDRGFSLPLVYSVLSGRNRASRGESFQISVALGLRAPPRHVEFFRPALADVEPNDVSGAAKEGSPV